ncbi:MAG TPA: iron ABC transporter permease, partial [Bacteroidota bacterium]|nr:iron ABC transporter permease [Bacteroidota bacterium]
MRKYVLVGVAAALAGAFALCVVYPLGMMLRESLTLDGHASFQHYRDLFDLSNPVNLEAVVNSVGVSLLSVCSSALVGIFLAFVLTQCTFPGRKILARLAVLPVALPPLVGVIAFLLVFGDTGIIPRGLQHLLGAQGPVFAAGGLGGVVLVHTYSFNVYYYLFVSAALASLDGSQLEASASLGSSPWRSFRRVVLPELRPAILAASVLTFMSSMASFTAPLLFASDRHFITLEIYAAKLNGDLERAAAQSILLTAVSVVFFLLLALGPLSRGLSYRGKGAGRTGVLRISPAWSRLMVAAAVLILLVELLPLVAVVALSLAREGSWTTQWIPSAYTLENYGAFFRDSRLLVPVLNSLLMALLALAGALAFGVTASYVIVRRLKRKWATWAGAALSMPYAVPGTVIAIALILAFNIPSLLGMRAVLVGTFWIMPLAYFIREYPMVVRSVTASLERLEGSLMEAAAGLGAGAWRQFRS